MMTLHREFVSVITEEATEAFEEIVRNFPDGANVLVAYPEVTDDDCPVSVFLSSYF